MRLYVKCGFKIGWTPATKTFYSLSASLPLFRRNKATMEIFWRVKHQKRIHTDEKKTTEKKYILTFFFLVLLEREIEHDGIGNGISNVVFLPLNMYGKSCEIFCMRTPEMTTTMILLAECGSNFFCLPLFLVHFKHYVMRRNSVCVCLFFVSSLLNIISVLFLFTIFNGSYIRVLNSHYIGFRHDGTERV